MRPADIAHGILPWLSTAVAIQAPATAYLLSTGLPVRVVDLAFGGIGLITLAWSKHTDSASYTTLQTKGAPAASAVPPSSPWGTPPSSV